MIRRSLLIAVAVVALISPALASAQSNGQITGVVRDATGGLLPGATVVITNQATKEARIVITDATGSYSQSVPPGSYTVAVSIQGFKRMTQQVDVQTGSSNKLEFSLETPLAPATGIGDPSTVHAPGVAPTPSSDRPPELAATA